MENEKEKILKLTPEQAEQSPIDVKGIQSLYSQNELEFEVCENKLLGNFDENFKYEIRPLIINELVKINKIIEFKDIKHYKAFANVDKNKLEFIVCLENLPENKIKASLKLREKHIIGKVYQTNIITLLKTFTDINTDNYLFKVKKEFHLYTADEIKLLDPVKDYVAPPIEIFTEFKNKSEKYKKLCFERENANTKYIVNILKAIKNEPSGLEVIKKFVIAVKSNKLEEIKEQKMQIYKQILDKILNEEIAKNTLSQKLIEEIAKSKNTYLEETLANANKYEQELSNEGAAGGPTKSNVPTKSMGGASKGGKGGGGGGSKGGGGGSRGGKGGGGGGSSKGGKSNGKNAEETKFYLDDMPFEETPTKTPTSAPKPQTETAKKVEVTAKVSEIPLNAFLSTFDTIKNHIKIEEVSSSDVEPEKYTHAEYTVAKTSVTTQNGQVIQQTIEIEAKFTNKRGLEQELDNNLQK